MSSQPWGTPEPGVHYLRHAGHDLEVRRTISGPTRDRPYAVIVDRAEVDRAWNVSSAKTKAMKMAEKTHPSRPPTAAGERKEEVVERPIAEMLADTEVPQINGRHVAAEAMRHADAPEPASVEEPGAVTFEMVGTIQGLRPAEAVEFLRAATDLIRQHAHVRAKLVLPSTIYL